jgi:ketosteroid isomerase-like protein
MSTLKFKRFFAGLAFALLLGVVGAVAQGPAAGAPPAQGRGAAGAPPQGPGPGFTPPPPPPTQGFESNIQLPATYTPQEAAAVAVAEAWVRNTAAHNLDGTMSLLDDNLITRPDPARQPAYGPVAQCSSYPFPRDNSIVKIDEMYVVGGPTDTMVLFKRADINSNAAPPGARGGGFGGFTVQVGVMVRVSNGKITEWLDAPINRIGGLVNSTEGGLVQPPGGANVAEACKKYPVAGQVAAQVQTPAPPRTAGQTLPYGTAKPERFMNVEEMQAAQTVRAWFAAKQAGDPLLLGAFVDQNVVYRTNAAAPFAKGRAGLLRAVCGTIGGQQRLTKLFPIGSDFDTMVLTESVKADGTRIASLFRVQKSLITEWVDVVVDAKGPAAAANPGSAACQAVNTVLPPA